MRLALSATAAVILATVVAAACSGSEPATTAEVVRQEPEAPAADAGQAIQEFALLKGPLSPDGTQAIFATADLGVGEHRVAFVLTSETSLVTAPVARVSSFFYPSEDGEPEPRQTTLATYRQWPYVARGTYTTRLAFDVPGRWGIDIAALDPDGPSRQAQLFFDVAESPATPDVGDPAVPSHNKTIADVERISQLSTGSLQDPELYQTTIAAAVSSRLPTVVVMASPAFCTNAVCGPQVEVLQELKDRYRGRANFIHVDFYDNPEEIQGDLSRARLSPTVLEWRIPSTEWSFVIDSDGVISERFEGFATFEELEQALLELL